jgi:DNA-binding GntR family transcriptional regulator
MVAARRIAPADIDALERLNNELLRADRRGDKDAVRRSNYQFHFRFYDAANQPHTLHFVRILWAKYPFDLLAVMPKRQQGVADEHREFLAALRARDVPVAVSAMKRHIESGWSKFNAYYPAASKKGRPKSP